MGRFVVLGAGVSGLTTAICLAESGHRVQVWSPLPPARTTSVVASAMWGPSFQQPMDMTLRWTKDSLDAFVTLADDPDSGVRMSTVITTGGEMPAGEVPPQVRLIPGLRDCRDAELPSGFTAGSAASMPVIDMPVYLGYLTRRLKLAGAQLIERRAGSPAEAARNADAALNCTGLAARELAGDDSVRPVFGQHVEVTNPGLNSVFMQLADRDSWVSWFPHGDRVVLGGVSIPDREDAAPSAELTAQILARCRDHEPRLRDAEVIRVRAGLRPERPVVRVERERVGDVTIVHNYGHGGSGVSLSWGCARRAAQLATARSTGQ